MREQEEGQDEVKYLTNKLTQGEGSLEEQEQWLERLKEIDPFFDGSDFKLQTETHIRGRRLAFEMSKEFGGKLTRDQVVRLIAKIKEHSGTDVETSAWHQLLQQNVPHPEVDGLIYWPQNYGLSEDPTAEEIAEAAFSYEPILVGPAIPSNNPSEPK